MYYTIHKSGSVEINGKEYIVGETYGNKPKSTGNIIVAFSGRSAPYRFDGFAEFDFDEFRQTTPVEKLAEKAKATEIINIQRAIRSTGKKAEKQTKFAEYTQQLQDEKITPEQYSRLVANLI